MTILKKNLALLIFFVGLMWIPSASLVHAAVDVGNNPPPGAVDVGNSPPQTSSGQTLINPLNKINSLPEFLKAILHAIVQLGTIVLTMAIVYVGFLFVAARGNAEKVSSARTALLWTIVGGLILLGAEAIGVVIQSTVDGLS